LALVEKPQGEAEGFAPHGLRTPPFPSSQASLQAKFGSNFPHRPYQLLIGGTGEALHTGLPPLR
jgi:hypothetical protein